MKKAEGFMRGINLGGWLSQFDSDSTEYFDTFITEQDIRTIASWGLDHVRLPVDYVLLEDGEGSPKEEGFAYIDQCLAWCRTFGLHLVLDLHRTFGYTFDPLVKDIDREAFFRDRALQERFFTLWERIARRYAAESDRTAFELLNEVVSPAIAEEWNGISREAVRRIRRYAPNVRILIGGVCYNSVTGVPLLDPPADDGIIYNFHCYEPMPFTHQKAYWLEGAENDPDVEYPDSLDHYRRMAEKKGGAWGGAILDPDLHGTGEDFFVNLFRPALEAAERYQVPLYCGEYGVIDRASAESTLRWYRDIHAVFEKYGIGRAAWTYREKDFGLTGGHYDGIRRELLEYL